MREQTISRRTLISASAATAMLAACSRPGSNTGNNDLVGVAVVGLGSLMTSRIIPALGETSHCYLAALVSSTRDKLREAGATYGIPESAQYTYEDFDQIAANPAVQLVYIAVPNALHADFAIRAARAGKHVLCEKPLATSVADAEAMIAASKEAGKFLAVAYRLQFSPHHDELIRLARERVFGAVKCVRASIGFGGLEQGDWRLNRALAGGGVLLEQGVYAVNAARSLIGTSPIEVFGHESKSNPGVYSEVEESVIWTMRFPKGEVAQCAASYTMPMNMVWAGASRGAFELDPAYTYSPSGFSSAGKLDFEPVNQFVAQFDDFALRIRSGVAPDRNSAEEGLEDLRIMEAIYQSVEEKRVVSIA